MIVEVQNKKPSFIDSLETLIYYKPLDIDKIKEFCNHEYFEKVKIEYFSNTHLDHFGAEADFSWESTISYIKLRFFRENKHVRTLRIKETDITDRTENCINLLKYYLEKIDLLKH